MDESQPNVPTESHRSSVGCLAIVLIVAAVGVALLWKMASSPPQGVGRRLPALQLVPLTGRGQPVALDDLRGRVALVNLWATRCPPCQAELPHMADLRKHFASDDDFILLAVSCGEESPVSLRRNTQELLSRLNLNLPTYADPNGTTRGAFEQAAAWRGGVPATFALDRSGVIRQVWVGYGPGLEDQMRTAIRQLLDE